MSFLDLVKSGLPAKRLDCFGKGGLLMTSKPYYLLFLIILLAYQVVWTNSWLMLLIIYTILPLFDEIFSLDEVNPSEAQRRQLQQNDLYFKLCLYLTVVADWVLFFKALTFFTSFSVNFSNLLNFVGLLFIFSNLNAVQFAVAHEIFHKPGIINKLIGTVHMSKNLYMHFTYEHLYGHHRRVATPEDPASAPQGIGIYAFFPKTFLGSYKSVYQMEQEQGKPLYLNCAVLSVVAAIGFTGGVFYFYNLQATLLFLIEAFLSIFYLEAINYIEHYGLQREKLSNGQYEKVTIRHSWNAPHRFSNYILYKLQRHSDHHENSLKPYQTLVSLEQSPHLPHGYSLMIFMSFFPKVWFSVMDPLVEEYRKNKMGKVQNEVTLRATEATKDFGIQLGGSIFGLWLLSLIL